MTHPTTAKEYVDRWNAGDTLTSISMGGKGMGDGYEHAIQQTAVVILANMLAVDFDIALPDEEQREAWKNVELRIADDPDLDDGLSGAMFYAARNLAAHFYRKGPAAVMTEEVVMKRHLRVSKYSREIDWMANE